MRVRLLPLDPPTSGVLTVVCCCAQANIARQKLELLRRTGDAALAQSSAPQSQAAKLGPAAAAAPQAAAAEPASAPAVPAHLAEALRRAEESGNMTMVTILKSQIAKLK
jgi:hypothetical protein